MITEDDKTLAEGLCRALGSGELEVSSCGTLSETHSLLRQGGIDLLLDINLPDGNGFDFLREIDQIYDINVIVLTANDTELDIVAGLDAGAVDYVTKPFSLAVLRARVQAQLRRIRENSCAAEAEETIVTGDYCFDFGRMRFLFRRELSSILYYVFDMESREAVSAMEVFLADFTQNDGIRYDYESKVTNEAEFVSLQSMFVIVGGVLSFIVGLVGVLNFMNSILMDIFARKRELAVLQAVGMTGRQLKLMLIFEGLMYTLGSVVVTMVLTVTVMPLISRVLGAMFWFFDYRFTVMPLLTVTPVFAVLGIVIPLCAYYFMEKSSVVERIREV